MITVITGAPRSGKSFYMVKHIYDNYIDKKTNQLKKGYYLITNITGLILPHVKLDEILKKYRVEEFFNVKKQEELAEKYGKIIYVIDECQRYFDETLKSKDVQYFFEYHGHLGIEIFLMLQLYKRLHRTLQGLEEMHIHANRKSTGIFNKLTYRVMSGSEQVDFFTLKKDKKIFLLYRSLVYKEHSKIKNPIIKYMAIAGISMIIAIVLFIKTFNTKQTNKKNNNNKQITEFTSSKPQIIKDKNNNIVYTQNTKLEKDQETNKKLIQLSYTKIGNDIRIVFDKNLIPLKQAMEYIGTKSFIILGNQLYVYTSIDESKFFDRNKYERMNGTNEEYKETEIF